MIVYENNNYQVVTNDTSDGYEAFNKETMVKEVVSEDLPAILLKVTQLNFLLESKMHEVIGRSMEENNESLGSNKIELFN